MVSGINQADDKSLQLLALQMQSKVNQADTDGISGLSKKELSSISADGLDAEAFLKTLTEQFDKFDQNQDGQLSTDEILNSSFNEQLGPPLGFSFEPINGNKKDVQSFAARALNKISENVNRSDIKNEIAETASNFFQKLIDNYKDVGVNALKTSLSSLI